MWNLIGISAASAFITGFTGSLHCALMCGPLACSSVQMKSSNLSKDSAPDPNQKAKNAVAWNLGRVLSYCVLGLLLGALGSTVKDTMVFQVTPVLPWLMALALVATAFDFGKHFKPIPGVRFIANQLARFSSKQEPRARAFFLGSMTPFLPCGLLYGIFLAALATGSFWGGALVMGAFSMGAVPTFLALQFGIHLVPNNRRFQFVFKKALPLLAAGVLVYRAMTSTVGEVQLCH